MYTISSVIDQRVLTLASARIIASTASHIYHMTADVIDDETGEVLATYNNGHLTYDAEWV